MLFYMQCILQGSYAPWKSWKTLDFYFSPEKPLKTLEFQIYPWKTLENWATLALFDVLSTGCSKKSFLN
jgi:hypothetical protein